MLRHRTLFASALVQMSEVRCSARRGGCGEVEAERVPRVVLPIGGAFAYHFSPRSETVADANTAIVLHPETEFRVSHPIDGGDCCLSLAFADDSAIGAMHGAATVSARAALAAYRARAAADRDDALAVEEALVVCVDALAERAPAAPARPLVERAKSAIAADPFAARSLDEIAREVGASPFHLTRSFRRATGSSLHAYRLRLRLAHGLERLRGGETLARVAVDCGFAHHSHFTQAFRRQFGVPPSELRKISTAS